jgi:WD40 repeat protein
VTALAFSPDGKTLAAGDMVKTRTVLWDVADREPRLTLDTAATALAFSPDGRTLATGQFYDVRLWDAAPGQELAALNGPHRCLVKSVTFSPDGKSLASAAGNDFIVEGTNGEIRVWDVAGRKVVTEIQLPDPVTVVAWAPDGKAVAAVCRYRPPVRL